MKTMTIGLALVAALAAALAAALLAGSALASPQAQPLREIWAEVEFDAQGQAEQLRFVGEAPPDEGVQTALRERVLRLKLPPPRPARLRSGLRMDVEIDAREAPPAQPVLRVLDMQLAPLVLSREQAPLPGLPLDFDQTYEVDCEVSRTGVCEVRDIRTDGALDGATRRWVLATMKRWRFQPPTLDGEAITSRTQVLLRLLGRPEAQERPDDFRQGPKTFRSL